MPNKFLIVANGPFLPQSIIHELAEGRTVVALDGACNKLAKIGILPQVILGDFDSINAHEALLWGIKELHDEITETSQPYYGNHGIMIVPQKDQNYTDLEKAIKYCDLQGAISIDIICALGGRVDQTLSNLRVLRSLYKKDRSIHLHSETQTMIFACNESVEIHGKVGDYCGIVAFPEGSFTSQGLRYNGNAYQLRFGYSESTSNQLADSIAYVEVQGETLIIHPGRLKSQRAMMDVG